MRRRAGIRVPKAALVVTDVSVVLVALLVLAVYEWPPASGLLDTLPFVLTLVFLASMDVQLPHGDTVDTDAAVVVASAFIFGPVVALAMVLLSRVAAELALRRTRAIAGFTRAIAKRAIGILAGAASLEVLRSLEHQSGRGYVEGLLLGLSYVTGVLLYTQILHAIAQRDSVIRLMAANLVLQGPVLGAEISAALLTIITFDEMGWWALAPAVLLALIARQSFSLLFSIRQGYQATIEALVGAMEVQRVNEPGAASNVAALARVSGAKYGWFGRALEELGYAALLAYFGLRFTGSGPSGEAMATPLADVEFLRPVVPILEAVERPEAGDSIRRRTLVAAYIVSLCVAKERPDIATTSLVRLRGQLSPKEEARASSAVRRAIQELSLR